MEYNRTMNETTFENKTQILADLWLNYRADGDFTDFVEYNDLGLPLAYAISAGIVPATDRATEFVEETFALLLAGMDITEDTGFESLDDLLQLDE
jgi:hypothetical protein